MDEIKIKGVGRIKYFIEGDKQSGRFIELMSVYIEQEKRRKGHGSELVTKLIELAKKNKISCIYLKVTPDNELFKDFLIKNGFFKSMKKLWQYDL